VRMAEDDDPSRRQGRPALRDCSARSNRSQVLERQRDVWARPGNEGTARVDAPAPLSEDVRSRRRKRALIISALVALMVVSSIAHLSALHRDLPLADVDEHDFVAPAVHIAATGDLNPHWFGHPGSTVIYPLAVLFHARNAVTHPEKTLSTDTALKARFRNEPTDFYVMARFWTIALSVGALPLLFLVGRRAFNARVALIATAIWAVLPLPVTLGRIVRTDSAGVFFGLLALWMCLRVLDDSRTRWLLLAGLSVGLAISSRYFMVALLPILVVAAVLPHRHAFRPAVQRAGIAMACAVGGFAATSPYFFLDWDTMVRSLQKENEPLTGHGGLSPLGNLRWYLGTAIPESLTWPLVILAVAGVLLVIWRRRVPQLLLLGFCVTFLFGICLSKLHWDRWLVEILPLIMLFAAGALETIVAALIAAVPPVRRVSVLAPVTLVAATLLLAVHPLTALSDVNALDANTSTRIAARTWVASHIPPGSRLGDDLYNIEDPAAVVDPFNARLDHTDLHVNYRIDPATDTIPDFQGRGYQFLIVRASNIVSYMLQNSRHPRQASFYRDVACKTRLVAEFVPTTSRPGWTIRVYQLTQPPRRLSGYFCQQPVLNRL
jgi:dolichyl-phosphate-mannose-protein mannosyltransferase